MHPVVYLFIFVYWGQSTQQLLCLFCFINIKKLLCWLTSIYKNEFYKRFTLLVKRKIQQGSSFHLQSYTPDDDDM
jgi:hypothetical protein